MDQLPRLNARLATLAELRDIVRAMRAMAASATREGEGALPAVRRYSDVVEAAVIDGLDLVDNGGAETRPREKKERLLCLIGTEHGFVGNLNARLVREAVRPTSERLFVVGRRAASAAAEEGLRVDGVLPMTSHIRSIPLLARQITERIVADEVRVAFCRHRPEQGISIVERQVVPVYRPKDKKRNLNPPLHHLPPIALLRAFAGEYLMGEIARALTEAFVGENATRLRVLTAADRNIGDKMDALRQMARQLRQETITSELLDIVIGVEAVGPAARKERGSTTTTSPIALRAE